jgi:hypothetical protein
MSRKKVLTLNKDKKFLLRDELKLELSKLKDKNNNYSTSKLKNSDIVSKIVASTFYMDRSTSERIYHIINDLYAIPECKTCNGDLDNFFSNNHGYISEYCKKNNCSRTSPLQKGTRVKQLEYFYPKLVKKYTDLISNDYEYQMFLLDDYKKTRNDTLIKLKHNCGYEYEISLAYQGHLKCPKCYPIRSKVQYSIYEYIKTFVDAKMNDRKLIAPKEIDILTNTFAIEYDSINYHSYGYHPKKELNNILEEPNKHLEKTIACENKNMQLFRIFSNEWYNSEDIWKSILIIKVIKGSTKIDNDININNNNNNN